MNDPEDLRDAAASSALSDMPIPDLIWDGLLAWMRGTFAVIGTVAISATLGWPRRVATDLRAAAAKTIRFIDTYRSYVINYNLGRDLVATWVARVGGDSEDGHWRAFRPLLSAAHPPRESR